MSKFKFHWGWATLLVYATFMSIFLYYFYRSFKELKTNELVSENYYEKELTYGEVLDKKKNADTMRIPVSIELLPERVLVKFPTYIHSDKIEGKIILYKPDNKALDQEIVLRLDSLNQFKIEKNKLVSGRWNIKLDWKNDSIPYFKEEKITIK